MSRRSMWAATTAVFILSTVGCNKKPAPADTTSSAGAIAAAPAAGAAATAPAEAPVELEVAAPPGQAVMLADGSGRAVYILTDAKGNVVECTGPCATKFVPVTGTGVGKAGDTKVNSSLAGSTTTASGAKQVTYNGKPLYYYSGDSTAGDTKGNKMKAGTATAHLVSPQGTANR